MGQIEFGADAHTEEMRHEVKGFMHPEQYRDANHNEPRTPLA